MSSKGSAVTHEYTGTRGSAISVSASSARNGSTAGSIRGEWKAPATGSRFPRTPRSLSCASASSSALRAPDSTSWSGALSFAIATWVAAATSAIASRLSSRARTAVIPPSPVSSAASCISRPRAATTRSPSSAPMASAATRAVISPSEWPAITSALRVQLRVSRQGRAVDRRLRPARALGGPIEQVGTDLAFGELEEIGTVALHRLAHVSGLAALPGKSSAVSWSRAIT